VFPDTYNESSVFTAILSINVEPDGVGLNVVFHTKLPLASILIIVPPLAVKVKFFIFTLFRFIANEVDDVYIV